MKRLERFQPGTTWSWWIGRPDHADANADALVLLPSTDVDELAAQHRTFDCSTWGQLRTLDASVYQDVLDMTGYDEGDAPGDEAPFDAGEMGPVADGDWPASSLYLMHERLPGAVIGRFGGRWTTTLNGDFAALRPASRDEVLVEIEKAGAKAKEDSRIAVLVQRDGWTVSWYQRQT